MSYMPASCTTTTTPPATVGESPVAYRRPGWRPWWRPSPLRSPIRSESWGHEPCRGKPWARTGPTDADPLVRVVLPCDRHPWSFPIGVGAHDATPALDV